MPPARALAATIPHTKSGYIVLIQALAGDLWLTRWVSRGMSLPGRCESFGRDSPPVARVLSSHWLTLWHSRRASLWLGLRFAAGFVVVSHNAAPCPTSGERSASLPYGHSSLLQEKGGVIKGHDLHSLSMAKAKPGQGLSRAGKAIMGRGTVL
jgi:hypothetical protein